LPDEVTTKTCPEILKYVPEIVKIQVIKQLETSSSGSG
jgi:hypothetical protein